ncbi:major facilitator superfamily domain-containing protein [Syncephalis fuscata]|nr:major facilitator superfamily domain-containing protein [Syncephalis fuscata]
MVNQSMMEANGKIIHSLDAESEPITIMKATEQHFNKDTCTMTPDKKCTANEAKTSDANSFDEAREVQNTSNFSLYSSGTNDNNQCFQKDTNTMEELSLRRRIIVFIGLALTVFLASLDQTIVSTAIPQIASDFDALDQVAWISIAYLLTSTAAQPLYGRFSDIFGRKIMFLIATTIFLAGSLGCGAANSIIMLIIMRGVAGIGGGGFIPLVMIIIADIAPPHQRGQYAGIVGAVFTFSSVIGPLLGGLFTDHLSWRWAFYINLPVGGIVVPIVGFLLKLKTPVGSVREKMKRVDYLGTLLVLLFCVALLLPINWGGSMYPWASPVVISLFCVAIIILAGLLWAEFRMATEPIVPLQLFRSKSICLLGVGIFLVGWGFISPIYYLPIFFQVIHGYSATQSGLVLLPFVLPVSIIVVVSGIISARVGERSYRLFMPIGMAIAMVGFGLITLFDVNSTRALEIGSMFVLGLGFGGAIQTPILAAQASVTPENIAIATALMAFFQIIGGVVGLAIEGAIFNNKLASLLETYISSGDLTKDAIQSVEKIRDLTEPIKSLTIQAHADALRMQYYVLIPVAGIAAIAFAFVKVLPQQQSDDDKRQKAPAMAIH